MMAAESRLLARVCYRAAFGVARRLVVTGRRATEPQRESDPVQVLGASATPAAPDPACGKHSRTASGESVQTACGEQGRTNCEATDDE